MNSKKKFRVQLTTIEMLTGGRGHTTGPCFKFKKSLLEKWNRVPYLGMFHNIMDPWPIFFWKKHPGPVPWSFNPCASTLTTSETQRPINYNSTLHVGDCQGLVSWTLWIPKLILILKTVKNTFQNESNYILKGYLLFYWKYLIDKIFIALFGQI